MKKFVLTILLLLVLFGCGVEKVEDVDGTFTCAGNTTATMGSGEEFLLYIENVFYVTDGYIDKEMYSSYMKYEDIEKYYNMTPSEYYNDMVNVYETAISKPGFSMLMPLDTGESIVVTHVTDYSDLRAMDEQYYPEKALNKDKTKVIYQKYLDEYFGSKSCELVK